MTDILVLFGGDARGAAQYGAIKYLYEHSYIPDIVIGSSIGAINGLFVAADRYDLLERFWQQAAHDPKALATSPFINASGKIDLRELFKPKNWSYFTRHLFGKPITAFAEPDGLRKFVAQICRHDVAARFLHQIVSLKTGANYSLWENDFPTDEDFHRSVVASASFPFVFPPSSPINTNEETIEDAMDGGLHQAAPLDDALKLARELKNCRITMIAMATLSEDKSPVDHVGQIIQRSISVILYNRFQQQLTNFIHEIQHDTEPIPWRLILPDLSDSPDFFEFTPEGIQYMIQQGYLAASSTDWNR